MKYNIFYSFLGGSKETGISSYIKQSEELPPLSEPHNTVRDLTSLQNYYDQMTNSNRVEDVAARHIADSLKRLKVDPNYNDKIIMFNNIKKVYEHILRSFSSNKKNQETVASGKATNFILSGFNRIDIEYYEGLGTGLKLKTRMEKTSPIFFDFNFASYPVKIKNLHTIYSSGKLNRNSDVKEQINKSNLNVIEYLFPIAGLLNHDDNPNCILREIQYGGTITAILISLRDIEANEQLTINYARSIQRLYDAIYEKIEYRGKLIKFESVEYVLESLKDSDWFTLDPNVSNEFLDLFNYLIQMNESVEEIIKKIKNYNNRYYEVESLKLLGILFKRDEEARKRALNLSNDLIIDSDLIAERLRKLIKVSDVITHSEMQEVGLLMRDINSITREYQNLNTVINRIEDNIKSLPNDFFEN